MPSRQPFPFYDHLTLGEIAELDRLLRADRTKGRLPWGTKDRFAELANRRYPPLYPVTPPTAA